MAKTIIKSPEKGRGKIPQQFADIYQYLVPWNENKGLKFVCVNSIFYLKLGKSR